MSALPNTALLPLSGLSGPARPAAPARQRGGAGGAGGDGTSFAQQLAHADKQAAPSGELQFSRHALERVRRRGIELDQGTLARLNQGVGQAAGKGSRDSLVLVDGTAFVVSVANRTVVTAVGSEHMREQVFTNIDSAVIA